ncbi:transcriptional regulator with XRE-family HTH domain [Lactobacillus colini]|uniref:Transcriptional regulator with XRE-family HTH domain n=1 Tax=Lactobacillus colini TaxID=1819254 RepID=A0ABS4MGA9_9LACO|nr:helix-turn-helix transcriptional regulator [Lactobacillus colini]MBP2058633.1 transcriptional regulator with XRE-family HTH domain [Lactobacillus colini]
MVDNTVFDRIKKLAERHGKSIVDVEAELGLSKNYLYKWKKSSPSSDKLTKVADYFKTSTDYLLGRTDDPSPASKPSVTSTDLDNMLDNARAFNGKPMTDHDREKARNILKALFAD